MMIYLSWSVWLLIILWYVGYRRRQARIDRFLDSVGANESVQERQIKRHEAKAQREGAERAERAYADDLEARDIANPPAGINPERWEIMNRSERAKRRHR